MKNKKKKILLTLPILIVVILGSLVLTKTVNLTKLLGLVNPMDLKSSDVPYTNNSQSTVQSAIDELYTKASTWINPNDFGIQRNTAKTVMATPGGVCIKRNGKVYCLGTNNWSYEQNHIKQVFSDGSCDVGSAGMDSDYVYCNATDFSCGVESSGRVYCDGYGTNEGCTVFADGSVYCY